jgi:hypothetical protein
MEDYFHATKVRWESIVELIQSYLKGYASTWWRTMRQREGKTPGYTWKFFKFALNSFQRILTTSHNANFATL